MHCGGLGDGAILLARRSFVASLRLVRARPEECFLGTRASVLADERRVRGLVISLLPLGGAVRTRPRLWNARASARLLQTQEISGGQATAVRVRAVPGLVYSTSFQRRVWRRLKRLMASVRRSVGGCGGIG